jgi:hypothetical protein
MPAFNDPERTPSGARAFDHDARMYQAAAKREMIQEGREQAAGYNAPEPPRSAFGRLLARLRPSR